MIHSLLQWLRCWLTLTPHFVVGDPSDPYLLRWYVIPRNRWCNIYLHKFLRSDDDRALHDHPWWFVSLVLWGGYKEHHPCPICGDSIRHYCFPYHRTAPSIAFRRAEDAHRVELIDNKPCWTLVITGPKVREWGFWCPQGWRHWREFTARDNPGAVGRGCE